MSLFRDYSFGYNQPEKDQAYWDDLRRKANRNLTRVYAGEFRKEPKEKLTELQRASADEIQSGFIVLEARRLRKELHRLLRRKKLEGAELGYAEELQSQVDDYDAILEPHSRSEQMRFVRLWNKSRKVKYKL